MKHRYNILFIVLALILASCGSNYHLRRANHHLKKAELKGAVWSSDTLFKKLEFKVPGVEVKFTPKILAAGKPMIFMKDSVITKVTIVKGTNQIDSVFVETKCPDRTIIKLVPVEVKNTIKAKSPWKTSLWLFMAGLIIGFILCLVFYGKTGGKVNIDLSDVSKRKN